MRAHPFLELGKVVAAERTTGGFDVRLQRHEVVPRPPRFRERIEQNLIVALRRPRARTARDVFGRTDRLARSPRHKEKGLGDPAQPK
jgi:hypothetical protein